MKRGFFLLLFALIFFEVLLMAGGNGNVTAIVQQQTVECSSLDFGNLFVPSSGMKHYVLGLGGAEEITSGNTYPDSTKFATISEDITSITVDCDDSDRARGNAVLYLDDDGTFSTGTHTPDGNVNLTYFKVNCTDDYNWIDSTTYINSSHALYAIIEVPAGCEPGNISIGADGDFDITVTVS